MANAFDRWRLKVLGVEHPESEVKEIELDTDESNDYRVVIKQIEDMQQTEQAMKGLGGKETAYSQPLLGSMSVNPGFKVKPNTKGAHDLHAVLKRYGSNIILNSIINTRANQVSLFCQPARYSEKGLGFQVRLKDVNLKPNRVQRAQITRIENFILNTGRDVNVDRDSFVTFTKKFVRDTYMFDQINFEKVFDRDGNFLRFVAKDPSTIFYATNSDGKIPTTGQRYVQVIDNKIVATFNSKEMAFAVRNPRSDIYAAGYGYPELEIALKHFIAHENTETFNDRFFSHGGTTRGILQIKASATQSQHALDMFKREWKNSLSGINGSWQIPVVSAEDVKFVNMTPSARDMEFEKWLNYLINVISSLYGIDPAEINFPNNGGATGSKGGSLNEGNSAEKTQASQNKGLLPLLKFIEDTINKYVVNEFGDQYLFQFVGGDISTELEKIKVLGEKGKIAMTVNEIRKELGLPGDVIGGDIPLNGVVVQRIGQVMQQEQFEYQKQQDNLNRLVEQTGGNLDPTTPVSQSGSGPSFQDKQQGLAGNADNVDGRGTANNLVGKDGQVKGKENTNSAKQGGKEEKPDKWKKE